MMEYRVHFTNGHIGDWHKRIDEEIGETIRTRYAIASQSDEIEYIEVRPVGR